MNIKFAFATAFAFAALSAIPVFAQQIPPQANPAPGCTSTPAQLEATKKAALDFAFLTAEAKVPLADPTYMQHKPVQHKRDKELSITDYEIFKQTFLAQAQGGGQGGNQGGGGGRGNAGPQPPAGNRAEIVIAQCDIVTIIHKVN